MVNCIVTNVRKNSKLDDDFYPTPPNATRALLDKECLDLTWSYLEPCCGDGAISKVLEDYGIKNITSSDLIDRGYGSVVDLMAIQSTYDVVITNPAFSKIKDHFDKLYSLADKKLILLLRTLFVEGKWVS